MDRGIVERVRKSNEKSVRPGTNRPKEVVPAEKGHNETRPDSAAVPVKAGKSGGIDFRF
jgi:hypothetical protein